MMKYTNLIKGLSVLIVMAIFTAGCDKDEPTPENLQNLSFDSEQILNLVPDGLKNSTDDQAQSCYEFIESAVDMSGFIDNMDVPDNAIRSSKKSSMSGADTWQWTWYEYGGQAITLYWTYEEDNSKRYWTMEIQWGTGPRYDFIEAWETKDGKQGEVIYNFGWAAVYSGEAIEDYEYFYWRYTWTLDNSGAYHLHFGIDSENQDYDYYLYYDVVINADGSGYVNYYLNDALYYAMTWDTMGNGTWEYYIGGEMYMNGTWSAG
jgi:hypothetical protein